MAEMPTTIEVSVRDVPEVQEALQLATGAIQLLVELHDLLEAGDIIHRRYSDSAWTFPERVRAHLDATAAFVRAP